MDPEAEPSQPKPSDYFDVVNRDMMELVPAAAIRVLDVGCAAGRFGEAFKEARGAGVVVQGIEGEPHAVRLAEKRLDRVFQLDLEDPLPALDGPYDCVTCGDVLEHVSDPWTLLRSLVSHLAPGGSVVASIPNIRYYPVLRDLVWNGRFTYRESGVLDATHLRFFTLYEMQKLFEGAGLAVTDTRPIINRRAHKNLGRLDRLLRGRLAQFRAIQYVVVGRRKD